MYSSQVVACNRGKRSRVGQGFRFSFLTLIIVGKNTYKILNWYIKMQMSCRVG